MPKKDAANTVLGMLSSAGAQTRGSTTADPRPITTPPAAASEPERAEPAAEDRPSATVSALPAAPAPAKVDEAPRTLRLRAGTARDLRAAWLEAKRDDVLLTAQDYASTLVEEALAARRRRARSASSS